MSRNDRQEEPSTDVVVNGEAKYSSPDTGERVKLDSSHDHSYTNDQSNYFQGNPPLEPGEVNWDEMEKVPIYDWCGRHQLEAVTKIFCRCFTAT